MLSELETEQAYVVTFELFVSSLMCCEETPSITLTKPILITKNSNPELISNYLKDRINIACETLYLDEASFENKSDGAVVVVKYAKINLF